MFRFRTLLHSSLLLTTALALTACQLPEPQKVGIDDTASYFVSHTDGKFTTVQNHANISIPVSRTLSLTACVRESSHSREILNHRFVIQGGEKDQVIITDSQGCLIWEEELAFNYLADESNITLRRTLHPEGQQQGERDVDFIVNPWAAKVYSSLDSRVKNAVPAEQAALSLQGLSQKDRRALWLDWVRLNVMQERIAGEKGTYIIEVSATLLIERMDDKRERQLLPLTYGKVLGRIQLICAMHPDGRDPMRVVIAQMDDIKAEVINGSKIFLNSKFTLSEFCPTTAYIMAGVSVRVPDAPALLVPFQGLYHGGPSTGMVGPMFSVPDGTFMDRFMKDKNYSVEKYLADNKAIYRNGTRLLNPIGSHEPVVAGGGSLDPVTVPEGTPGAHFPNGQNPDPQTPDLLQKFRLEVRELQAMNYGFQQQYYKDRTLTFRVRACLRLGIDQQAIRATTFKVRKTNGKTEKVTTLDDGCMEFEDSVTYNHFAKECWLEKTIGLQNSDFGYNENFKVQINPWNRGSQWFKDVRWLPQGDRAARCIDDRPSQILLDYYFMDYSTNRYSYGLDEYLNLNQKRLANISLRPLLSRGSFESSTGYVNEALPAGKYLLRYALVDQSISDFSNAGALQDRIYGVDRALVSIREDGAISDRISFFLDNEAMISLGLLNQFVIEILPLRSDAKVSHESSGAALEAAVDHDHAIQVVPFVAQFIHRAEGGGLRKLDQYVGRSLVLELEKPYVRQQELIRQGLQAVARKEVFARLNGLSVVNLNNASASLRLRTQLGQMLALQTPSPELTAPVAEEELQKLVETGQMNRDLAVRTCGYIFRALWKEKLPGKNHGLLAAEDENEEYKRLFSLQWECIRLFDENPSQAFDIEFEYIVHKPSLKRIERCATGADGKKQCVQDVVPERVDPRSFSISNSFSLSRSFGVHEGVSMEAKAEADLGIGKFLGVGAGFGYSIGSAENLGQSNSVGISQDMSMVMETLQFKVRAEDAERCVMVRLNPSLFDLEDPGFFLWNTTTRRTLFARYLREDLTIKEKQKARQQGLLLCDGALLKRPIEFSESFYLVRPNTPAGMLGDEKSRATVDGLFATLRGVNDMTAFMSRVTYSEKIPASFQRELQARQLDTSRLREAFDRGSRAMPGVYSTVSPIAPH